MQLGTQIRQLRRQQQLTQAQLAKRANVSLSAVKYLEAGRGSSLATLVRVARALGRSDWFAALAPAEPSYSPLSALRERTRAERTAAKRVRHPAAGSSRETM